MQGPDRSGVATGATPWPAFAGHHALDTVRDCVLADYAESDNMHSSVRST